MDLSGPGNRQSSEEGLEIGRVKGLFKVREAEMRLKLWAGKSSSLRGSNSQVKSLIVDWCIEEKGFSSKPKVNREEEGVLPRINSQDKNNDNN